MGERGDEANVRDVRVERFGVAREDEGGASENDDKCSRNKAAIQKAAECVFIFLSLCVCARVFVVEALFIVSMYQRRFSRMMCIKKKINQSVLRGSSRTAPRLVPLALR